jgi:hypothetical protein
MRTGVEGGQEGFKVQKYTSVIECCSRDIFFRAKNFVDDDSGLSTIVFVSKRTELL